MFHGFILFVCFVLIFLSSKKSLLSKIVISLDYCFNYIHFMSHSGM